MTMIKSMSKKPIRIAITGATGRMGHQLIQAIKLSDQVILGAALTHPNSEMCGVDVGKLSGGSNLGVIINSKLSAVKEDFDTLIDFTRPEATLEYINFCCRHNKGMVIGTTGFNKLQKITIRDAARQIGIVFTANFSVGANLMLKLLGKTAQIIGNSTDIAIIEAHHRHKVDAPSGTALAMEKSIAKGMGNNLSSCAVYNTKKHTGQHTANNISFATIRAGDIVGEHTAIFADIGERLEIIHKASSRIIFANGAIRAAIWLGKNKTGLFDMLNVLSLDKL
ncbi:MAG: 4-hydroxy-tetrahydrodipicolinate reductase [Sodalis sp. Ffu]|nr:MAG: 4-hydroxy-tetrahydrodipicolinate reductase [Sodalis sp. Ffu]